MASFLDKLRQLGRPGEDDYTEVDLGQFEEMDSSSGLILRFADLAKVEMLPEIKQEIYSGRILLVDISGIKRDKDAMDKALGELKKAVDDISGDIAGIGDDLIVIVPSGIRIDREKIIGGTD
jgi:hypothetical protein